MAGRLRSPAQRKYLSYIRGYFLQPQNKGHTIVEAAEAWQAWKRSAGIRRFKKNTILPRRRYPASKRCRQKSNGQFVEKANCHSRRGGPKEGYKWYMPQYQNYNA